MCFIGGLCSAALSIVLGLRFGMLGVVLGSGIEMFISRGLVMAWFVQKCTGLNSVRYLLCHVWWPGIKGALPPAVFAWFSFPVVTPDYGGILLFAAGYGVVFCLSFPWTVMDGSARRLLWSHLPVVGTR